MSDFKPANPNHSYKALATKRGALQQKQLAEAAAMRQAAALRDETLAAELDLHSDVLGAKTAVKAQYGVNSNELQAVGLKKASERKRPVRKTPGNSTTQK